MILYICQCNACKLWNNFLDQRFWQHYIIFDSFFHSIFSCVKPYQIIIADGGKDLQPVINQFSNRLNVIRLACPEVGQVLQRNHAHKYLNKNIQLVIHLDDDITLEHDSLRKMIMFWNEESQKSALPLAGASFNIKDVPELRSSILRNLFFLQTKPAGHVSIAGYAAPLTPTETNMQTSWLLGGATAWSRDVIEKHQHPINYPTRWAICEDLIYSYLHITRKCPHFKRNEDTL